MSLMGQYHVHIIQRDNARKSAHLFQSQSADRSVFWYSACLLGRTKLLGDSITEGMMRGERWQDDQCERLIIEWPMAEKYI